MAFEFVDDLGDGLFGESGAFGQGGQPGAVGVDEPEDRAVAEADLLEALLVQVPVEPVDGEVLGLREQVGSGTCGPPGSCTGVVISGRLPDTAKSSGA
ncbi:hypothetical protein O1L60_38805 [Streptomyces diastatochromogenes]|nr:hypothetical protein [Streptomyces diastatochromogenes]